MINENIKRHIKTHAERSVDDRSAISVLETFLRTDGKINHNFAANDKWPNIDGSFEFVSNPNISRRPEQNFIVQIKGTGSCSEEDGIVRYQLKSLGFPASICEEITLDPGILFVVLNAKIREQERVFWKYMSTEFLSSIDFSKDSMTIKFTFDDEIKNTDKSIENFCDKLEYIANHHSFVKRLENRSYSEYEVKKIIMACEQEIRETIDKMDIVDATRDDISKRMLRNLEDMCSSTLLLNIINMGFKNPNLRLAWEKALFNKETRYLCTFLKGLRYIGSRIPEDGQSERLMLKYYNFLWQIKNFLYMNYNMRVLANLEKFPLNINTIDQEYYEILAKAIESGQYRSNRLFSSRFYVQKKIPFFVGKERYYEITLQLSGKYSSKYNRITVYSKKNIDTDYSIQISYKDIAINLWTINLNIKVITSWKVSIEPICLNKLGEILRIQLKLNTRYREYDSLMTFLTSTGINLLDLIDIDIEQFNIFIDKIYKGVKTEQFKEVLLELQKNYSKNSTTLGRYTIRYLILHLKEEALIDVLPSSYHKQLNSQLCLLSSKCYPFEKNPYIANLVGRKTTSPNQLADIQNVTGIQLYDKCRPYVLLKNLINTTGEIYFPLTEITSKEKIDEFNSSLDSWQRSNGDLIIQEDGLCYIESFEKKTTELLKKLLEYSNRGNKGQKELNGRFIKNVESVKIFDDSLKKQALQNIFTDSQIALIYGAAGTGKTSLINYISNLMNNKRKLFLTKTHTTLQNLKRRIDNQGLDSDFISIDRFTKKVSLENYDIIFVDECSIIDNDTMLRFMSKISEDTFLVLAGDIFQIESINFGNWFFYAKDIIKTNGANIELTNTWRTEDKTLIELWNEVRIKAPLITEKLSIDGTFSEDIGAGIFNKSDDDEVVLCLNYDGKFGLNSMNQYFQNANKNGELVTWKEWGYKIGDPIIFNDTERFELLYNNLKGRIVDIVRTDEYIMFTIDVNILLTESDCRSEEVEYIGIIDDTTRISFKVFVFDDSVEENEINQMVTVIPFQIAYAISIHKAQGLEFNSVKLIITSSNSEKITHDVFYTAITRAKKNLKIFWSSETMKMVIEGFSKDDDDEKSLTIIKSKLENSM